MDSAPSPQEQQVADRGRARPERQTLAVPGVYSATFDLQPGAHEMAIPDYQTLMLPVLEFTSRGETNVRDCIAGLAGKLELTEEERREIRRVILMMKVSS